MPWLWKSLNHPEMHHHDNCAERCKERLFSAADRIMDFEMKTSRILQWAQIEAFRKRAKFACILRQLLPFLDPSFMIKIF